MSLPPLAFETPKINIKKSFKSTEKYDFMIENKKYILNISYNEEIIQFHIIEENSFPLKEYNLYNNFDDLKQIDKFFYLFENIGDIFTSLKRLKSNNNLKLIKEEQEMKIEIQNSLTNKNFFITIPKKEPDIDTKVDNLMNYINTLKQKIENLENELKISKNENTDLKKTINAYENKIKNLEKKFDEKISKIDKIEKILNEYMKPSEFFKNSKIIKKDEVNLILSWLDKKPTQIDLLLNSKKDGDSISTFYEKCFNKCPTMIFVKTTEFLRFGGYASVTWPERHSKRDDGCFLFSLDKKKKYKINENQKENAIYFCKNISFCFGSSCDLYICDKCTSNTGNQVGNGSFDMSNSYELNNGKKEFKVKSYEVYHIIY